MRPGLVLLLPLLASAAAGCAHRRATTPPADSADVAAKGDAPSKPDPDAALRRPDVRTVSGNVAALAWQDARVTLQTDAGPLTLAMDRNTLVFTEARLGSVRDLAVGMPVRAGIGAADHAAWIEIRPRGATAEEDRTVRRGASPAGEAPGAGGTGEPQPGGRGGPPTSAPTPPSSAPAPGSPAGPSPVPGGVGGPGR